MIFVTSILSVHGATALRLYLFVNEAYLSKVSYTVWLLIFDREEIPKLEESSSLPKRAPSFFIVVIKKSRPFWKRTWKIICLLERWRKHFSEYFRFISGDKWFQVLTFFFFGFYILDLENTTKNKTGKKVTIHIGKVKKVKQRYKKKKEWLLHIFSAALEREGSFRNERHLSEIPQRTECSFRPNPEIQFFVSEASDVRRGADRLSFGIQVSKIFSF